MHNPALRPGEAPPSCAQAAGRRTHQASPEVRRRCRTSIAPPLLWKTGLLRFYVMNLQPDSRSAVYC